MMPLLLAADASSIDWISPLISGIVVAIISAIFQHLHENRLKGIEAKLASRSGFFLRKLKRHEQLWPLVAQCNRAQSTLANHKRQGGNNLGDDAKQIAECRKNLKNFVYDNGLYFDDALRQMVQDLDTALADPSVTDVTAKVKQIEAKLREVLKHID